MGEAALGLLASLVLGPLLLVVAYRLIELSGETALGHEELLRFAFSPLGAAALLLIASGWLALAFIEYSGLIVLADAAMRGRPFSLPETIARVLSAAPRLSALAGTCIVLTLASALPFAALAGAVYWLLLSQADINYYLTEQPPRYWVALGIGVLLAAGFLIVSGWLLVRWALAVPACVLDRQGYWSAARTSAQFVHGRAIRIVTVFVLWQLLRFLALAVVAWALNRLGDMLLAGFAERLPLVVWSTLGWLLVEAVAVQILAALFAIALAAWIAHEYEQARAGQGTLSQEAGISPRLSDSPQPPTARARAILTATVLLAPAIGMGSSLLLAHEWIDHRPAQVTAHRAGSKNAPENSLTALQASIAAGADYVEIDVQQTVDGHVVLLHDRDLRRVTADPRDLHTVTLAELAPLRLRDARGPSDEHIPTLAEFIAACGDSMRINIELKDFGHSSNLAPAVSEVLQAKDFTQRAIVSSFARAPLAQLKQAEPQLRVGAIMSAVQGDPTRLPVDFLSLNHRLVTADLVRRAHRRGMEVHAWTVNDQATAVRLLELGCDNILTSDPVLMRKVVDQFNALSDIERLLLRLRRAVRG